jgi:tetratricopeptide (TPR) repeat protein
MKLFFYVVIVAAILGGCFTLNHNNYLHYGKAQAGKQNYAEALLLFEKALELKPDLAEAMYQAALMEEKLDRPEKAIDRLIQAIKLRKNYVEARHAFARIRFEQGYPRDAYVALWGLTHYDSVLLRFEVEMALVESGVTVLALSQMNNREQVESAIVGELKKHDGEVDVTYLIDRNGEWEDIVNNNDEAPELFRELVPYLAKARFSPSRNIIMKTDIRGNYHLCARVKKGKLSQCVGRYDYGVRGLPSEVIDAVIDKNKESLIACYHREVIYDEQFEGNAIIRFRIGPSGEVKDASMPFTTLPRKESRRFQECISAAFTAMKFPQPHGDRTMVVVYPVRFVVYN